MGSVFLFFQKEVRKREIMLFNIMPALQWGLNLHLSLTGNDAELRREKEKWFSKQDLLFLSFLEKSLGLPRMIGVGVGSGDRCGSCSHTCVPRAAVTIVRSGGVHSPLSWLPMLAASLSSTAAPTTLMQHTHGWEWVLSLHVEEAGQRLVYSHGLPSDLPLMLSSVCETC